MTKDILSILFILAAGQGIFLGGALLWLAVRQPAVRMANSLLAGLMLGSVVVVVHAWLGLHGLYRTYPHSALVLLPMGFLPGPLLYLYLLAQQRALTRRDALHFLPFALVLLACLPFYLQSAEAKLAWMMARHGPPWYVTTGAALKLAIFLFYLRASARLPAEGPLANSLRRLLNIWAIGGTLNVGAFALELVHPDLPVSSDAIGAVALLVFVYATSFMAIQYPLGYRQRRYEKTALPESAQAGFLARLEASMAEEQLYRDGALTLESLAAHLAMTPHELSQLINGSCGVNFQEYLNRHRVDDLKRALLDPVHAATGILELAMASGFNSKSALNRVFKAQTGMTPSEFRRPKS